MNRQIAFLAFLTLCGCPQNDIGDTAADEAGPESTSAQVPDLSGSDSESSSTDESDTESSEDSTDSEDSESTTDIDSESTSGDDDIGETGSEAVPTSLSVEAGGQRIGYLMLVQDYGLYIWDDVVPAPVRRSVSADAPFGGGHVAPTGLFTSAGEPTLINVQSLASGVDCIPYAVQLCMLAHVSTNVIPQTFALPITVVETAP